VKNFKLFTLLTLIAGYLLTSIGCSKSNNNNNSAKDSVLYSAWQPFNMKFEGVTTYGDSVFDQTVVAKSVTQSVLDKGVVLVYVKDGTGLYADATNAGISLLLDPGEIYMTTNFTVTSNFSFRYVVIPGGISTTSVSGSVQTYTPAQLKKLPYSTVAGMLHVPMTGSSLK
jgi:hypothetical protein